jgi:Bacterial Ig-like domain (group 3)
MKPMTLSFQFLEPGQGLVNMKNQSYPASDSCFFRLIREFLFAPTSSFRQLSRLLCCGMAMLGCGVYARGATTSSNPIVTIDAPDASAALYRGTAVLAIDASGNVAGVYSDANNVVHSFLRSTDGTITEFEAPLVNGLANKATVPIGFDAAGDLVGVYGDATGRAHGFFRTASGVVSSIDVPSSIVPSHKVLGDSMEATGETIPTFVDAAGDVAGIYLDVNKTPYGFLLPAGGSITTFEAASLSGKSSENNPGTYYVTVNPTGGVAGTYLDASNGYHGFVRSQDGTIVTIDAPGAGTGAGLGTAVTAIDGSGNVGGLYLDANKVVHGFVRTASGTFSTFDAPAARSGNGQSPGIFPFSYPLQFDAAGDLAGVYLDAEDVAYGFVRSANGTITTFAAPDAAPTPTVLKRAIRRLTGRIKVGSKFGGLTQGRMSAQGDLSSVLSKRNDFFAAASLEENVPTEIEGTAGLAMNPSGEISGIYTDGEAGLHSFVRAPSGAITEFSVPDAGDGVYQGTVAFAINCSGTVAGTYLDANSELHGFVAALGELQTTTTLKADPGSAVYGQPVTFTASVSSGSTVPPDGETIQFVNGLTVLGMAAMTQGTATLTTTALAVAADSITAVYAGDFSYAGSASNAVSVSVGVASTSTRLTSSPDPSSLGQSVTFTAYVTGSYGGTATGTMVFSSGSGALGSSALSGNAASVTTSSLAAGTSSVTATYSGDGNFASSTSDAVVQTVNGAAPLPNFSLTSSPGTLTIASGSAGTLKVTVTPTNGFSAAVSFACSGLPAGASCAFSPATVTPAGGAATTTLTIAAGANTAHSQSGGFFPGASLAMVACVIGWRRRRGLRLLLVLALTGAGLALFSGCGGSGNSSSTSTPFTSSVTITGTSGSLQQTATVSLTVH